MGERTRVVALDVGEKRIGVAVSDPLGLTAQSVDTIFRRGDKADIAAVEAVLQRFDTDRLLLGLPHNLKGEEGAQAEYTRRFAEKLTARGWKVRYYDERMTTALARGALIDSGMRREQRKEFIDRVAATYILQDFIDAGGWKSEYTGEGVYKMAKDEERFENNELDDEEIITLVDENGEECAFRLEMAVEVEGDTYLLLSPAEPMEGLDDDEVAVLKVETDENGDEIYVSVEDEATQEAVFQKYLDIVEADADDEGGEE